MPKRKRCKGLKKGWTLPAGSPCPQKKGKAKKARKTSKRRRRRSRK